MQHEMPDSCVLRSTPSVTIIERFADVGVVADVGGNEMGRSLVGYTAPVSTSPSVDVVPANTGARLLAGLDALGEEW